MARTPVRGKVWMLRRRAIVGLGTILAVLLSSAGAGVAQADPGPSGTQLATPVAAPAPPVGGSDFAVGGGDALFLGQTLHFAFSAHQNSPNPPTGYVVLRGLAPTNLFGTSDKIGGPVQCLAVAAKLANIIFTVKQTNNPTDFPVGEQIVVTVQDNGQPDSTPPDLIGAVPATLFPPSATQAVCSGHVVFVPHGTVTQGNIVVQDPVTALLPSPVLTDNATYRIDSNFNLYTNDGSGWVLMQ